MKRLRMVLLGAGVVGFLGSPSALGAGNWGALDPDVPRVNGVSLSVSGQSLTRIDPNSITFGGNLISSANFTGSLSLRSGGSILADSYTFSGDLTSFNASNVQIPALNGGQVQIPARTGLLDPFASISVNQMVPAANRPLVPASTALGQSIVRISTGPVPPARSYGLAVSRPDFSYQPAALKYQKESSSTTGQTGMAIAPGLPAGTVRYVPVGEF